MTDDPAQKFYQKAMAALAAQNYSLAEFYLQAAIKEWPDNKEYQDKLEETKGLIEKEREKEAADADVFDKTPGDIFPEKRAAKSRNKLPKKKPSKAVPTKSKEFKIFGIQVRGLNQGTFYLIILAVMALSAGYFTWRVSSKEDPKVDVTSIKESFGIELVSASIGERQFVGVVDESWDQMTPNDKKKGVSLIYEAFRKSRKIKSLTLWNAKFSTVAKASDDGVKILQ